MTGQRMPIDTMVRHCYVSGGAKRAYKIKRNRLSSKIHNRNRLVSQRGGSFHPIRYNCNLTTAALGI